jgi:hypothetical protein
MKYVLLALIFPLIMSCRERFNGKNEQSFKLSKEKIEHSLNQKEKTNLEKSLRVVAEESMRLKWEKPDEYKGQSFNEISLNMIDGLSYSSVVSLAEKILKDGNKREIEKLGKDIDTLNLQKKDFVEKQKLLDVFRVSSVSITKTDFFDEMVPELQIDYQYIGKDTLYGTKAVAFTVIKKSTNQVINSVSIEQGDSESAFNPLDVITETIIINDSKENNRKLWNSPKYPIENPNLADYDLELHVNVLSVVLKGKRIELPKIDIPAVDDQIKNKQKELDEFKQLKGTLDELELTDN